MTCAKIPLLEDSAAKRRQRGEDQLIDDRSISEFVARAAAGDQQAFRKLVDATNAVVFRVALRTVGSRADADDVVQETYVRAWKRIGSIRDGAAVTGWLCRIARNVSIDLLRKRKRRKTRSLDESVADGAGPLVEAIASSDPIASEVLESASIQKALAGLLADVKEKYRIVLMLREVDGMSYDEIATALDIPSGTVESRLHRGRKELAKKIERWRIAQAREAA